METPRRQCIHTEDPMVTPSYKVLEHFDLDFVSIFFPFSSLSFFLSFFHLKETRREEKFFLLFLAKSNKENRQMELPIKENRKLEKFEFEFEFNFHSLFG